MKSRAQIWSGESKTHRTKFRPGRSRQKPQGKSGSGADLDLDQQSAEGQKPALKVALSYARSTPTSRRAVTM